MTSSLGEPQRDEALAEHVLHRLPEPEIDPERQRSDDLGKAHPTHGRYHANILAKGRTIAAQLARPARSPGRCRYASVSSANVETLRLWPSVKGDLRSTKSAKAWANAPASDKSMS